jgi:hypothetical protein
MTPIEKQRIMDMYWAYQAEEAKRAAQEEKDIADKEYAHDVKWGNRAAQGASLGMTVTGGNPYGAAVGAGLGSLIGTAEALSAASKKGGHNMKKTLWNAFKALANPLNSIPDMEQAVPLATQFGSKAVATKWGKWNPYGSKTQAGLGSGTSLGQSGIYTSKLNPDATLSMKAAGSPSDYGLSNDMMQSPYKSSFVQDSSGSPMQLKSPYMDADTFRLYRSKY